MAFMWTKQLSVGNETLDAEHQDLIGIVNRIEHAIETRNMATLLYTFKLLKDRAHFHFASEEQFAEVIGFSIPQHKQAHQLLLKELKQTGSELELKSSLWPEYVMDHYPQFLREWLVDHILKEDMLMKPALQARPYDFKLG